MADTILTQEYLHQIFEYKDGNLYSKKKRIHVEINSPCGYFCIKRKYQKIKIKNKTLLLHRVIFLFHHGYLPDFIDHIDGNCLNNKIENLRPATKAENCRNRSISSTNTSGFKGVSWCKVRNKWNAYCTVNYKKHNLGYYKDIHEAKDKVIEFRKIHHKEFCRIA